MAGFLSAESKRLFLKIHEADWEKTVRITDYFEIIKNRKDIREINQRCVWNVHYFDAFSPSVQPELWEKSVLQNIYEGLKSGGFFVTYSAKGSVRRNLIDIGFRVEKLPGPPGKREMLRGIKPE